MMSATMAVSLLSSPQLLEIIAPSFNKNWGGTYSKKYEVSFTWALNNFSFLEQNVTHESPTFSGGPNGDMKWCLDFRPPAVTGNEYFYIGLKLISTPQSALKTLCKFKCSIIDIKCRKTYETKLTELNEFQAGSSNTVYLIKKKLLLEEANVLLPKDTLTILCEIQIVGNKVKLTGCRSAGQFEDTGRKLSGDFGNLESQNFSDITLVVGEHEFPAHKAILSARSDVFAAMFEHKMEEDKSGRVAITDIDHDVLQELIRYIYTGDVLKMEEMPDRLLSAADKYQLKNLRLICEEELLDNLSIENAIKILILADRHSTVNLKEQTINYINNHAIDIIKQDEWKNLIITSSHLIAEIFESLVTQFFNKTQ